MEDLKTVKRLITLGCFMATIDLKDSYYLVAIHNRHRKYLRFKFKKILYEFNCLPFGLCTAPRVFAKLLKPVSQWLRVRGVISAAYIDDKLIIAPSYNQCLIDVSRARKLLESLGFVLNLDKCQLEPNTRIKFLGVIIDSVQLSFVIPDEKLKE